MKTDRKWLSLVGVGIGVFMSTLDGSIVNVSLPTLVAELHTDFATIQWVVLSYILVLASLVLGAARLGDMFPKKKLYLGGLVVFTLASLLCGTAQSVGWLIAFRTIQGLGAVMLHSLGIAIVTEIFPNEERGRALGIMGAIVSIGIASGPAIGGLLIGTVGWHSIFLVNVPVGIVAMIMLITQLPSIPPAKIGQKFDVVGAVCLFLTLVSYAMAMTLGQRVGFGQPLVLGLLAGVVVGLVTFIVVELRVEQPMVDLRLFQNRIFTINLITGFLVFIVLSIGMIFPFFLELVQGYPTQVVGLILMASPIAMGVAAPLSGILSDRFGSRYISLVGLLVIIFSCWTISTVYQGMPIWLIVLCMTPLGFGIGLFQSPNNSAIMGAVPRSRLGIASGLLALSRTLGQTTGLPFFTAIFSTFVLSFAQLPTGIDVTTAPPLALVAGIRGIYRLAGGIVFISACLAVAALYFERRKKTAPELESETVNR